MDNELLVELSTQKGYGVLGRAKGCGARTAKLRSLVSGTDVLVAVFCPVLKSVIHVYGEHICSEVKGTRCSVQVFNAEKVTMS